HQLHHHRTPGHRMAHPRRNPPRGPRGAAHPPGHRTPGPLPGPTPAPPGHRSLTPRRATRPDSRRPPALGRPHPLTTHPTPASASERPEKPMPNAGTVHSIIQTVGRGIWSSTTTPAGVLVTLSGNDTTDVINALRAAGYTATEVGSGTVMVGGVDRIALLDAQ